MQDAASALSLIGLSGHFLEANNKQGAEYINSLGSAWNNIFKEFSRRDI
jgi:hypothetical protein